MIILVGKSLLFRFSVHTFDFLFEDLVYIRSNYSGPCLCFKYIVYVWFVFHFFSFSGRQIQTVKTILKIASDVYNTIDIGNSLLKYRNCWLGHMFNLIFSFLDSNWRRFWRYKAKIKSVCLPLTQSSSFKILSIVFM